jgi:hypothetical protein
MFYLKKVVVELSRYVAIRRGKHIQKRGGCVCLTTGRRCGKVAGTTVLLFWGWPVRTEKGADLQSWRRGLPNHI